LKEQLRVLIMISIVAPTDVTELLSTLVVTFQLM